jgi:hypothetical protein
VAVALRFGTSWKPAGFCMLLQSTASMIGMNGACHTLYLW